MSLHVIACHPYVAKLNKHLLLKEPQQKADKILGRCFSIVWKCLESLLEMMQHVKLYVI